MHTCMHIHRTEVVTTMARLRKRAVHKCTLSIPIGTILVSIIYFQSTNGNNIVQLSIPRVFSIYKLNLFPFYLLNVFMVAGLCHFIFSSFRGEKTPREKTPCEKTKRRKTPCEKTIPTTQETKFQREKTKNTMRKDAICNFNFVVFSPGVISSCHLFAWRIFVFSQRKDAMRKDEKTK